MNSWRQDLSRSFSSLLKQFLRGSNSDHSVKRLTYLSSILSQPALQSPATAAWWRICIHPRSISSFSSSFIFSSRRFISSFGESKRPLASDSASMSQHPRGRVADRPKAPRPSTPLGFLGKSRSTRFRQAAAERGSEDSDTAPQKIPFRLRKRMQYADAIPKKKKKRPPPGPVVFEDLTAKKPAHSDLPFAFRYSYTEIPKKEPVGFQEKFSPFGPGRLDREWNGQAALPNLTNASIKGRRRGKKTHKKMKTREEVLGEPLTKEEITELVECNIKSKKQINLGRDGLTHNMLNDVHNHWKRECVVRVKCKGVSTIDMDNVLFQLEDKTGGKVIHRVGGTVYLFRGRNYDYKDRPHIPLMLWRPHSPIYPRLVTQKPGGLTLKEANELRKRGRKIMPLCKLAKNGYYADLIQHVREAFEDDELVRIDCKGLNISDYKKIGAKLRDLVPCVLLSFQREQILIWKGRNPNALALESTAEAECGEPQIQEHAVDDGSCNSPGGFLEGDPTYAAELADESKYSAVDLEDEINPCMYSSDDSSDNVESTIESSVWAEKECSNFASDDVIEDELA